MLRPTLVALLLILPVAAAAEARPFHVTFLGDSLAYGAGDEEGKGLARRVQPELRNRGFAAVETTNLGRNGATSGDVRARLREKPTRDELARADAIVLSMGANDLRAPLLGRSRVSPVDLVDGVLHNVRGAVAEMRRINPRARILILGAYAPVPQERIAVLLRPFIVLWDTTLATQFAEDPLVSVVPMSDIVGPDELSPIDSFHPGAAAYQQTAARIAGMLAK